MTAAKTDLWYPFFIGDYRRDTARLSCEQHGAYRLLIDEYWITGPLPDDDVILARLVGLEVRVWKKHRPVIARFFTIEGGEWRHGRIDRELVSASARKAKAEERARTAAEARWSRSREHARADATSMLQAMPEHMLEECPPPSPREVEDADASSVGSAKPMPTGKAKGDPWLKDAEFMAAWSACTEQGRTRSSRRQAWAAWKANRATSADKLAALKAYLARDPDVKRTGGPGFHLWLRDKLDEWLGAATPAPAARWTGPGKVIRVMDRAFGSEKARGYLTAYCTWQDAPFEALIVSSDIIADMIRRAATADFEAIGARILVKGRAA